MKGPYRPKEFWERWGKTFYKEPDQRKIYPEHYWILENLKQIRPQNLLEIGCGFGRNIKFLAENYPYNLRVTGCDFSSSMLIKAKKFLKTVKFVNKKPVLIKADILDLPFANSSFDVVLLHGVLMHIQPKNIKKAILQATRVTKKYLILVEQNFLDQKPRKKGYAQINKYTFAYNYQELFREFGGKIVERKKGLGLVWLLIKFNND